MAANQNGPTLDNLLQAIHDGNVDGKKKLEKLVVIDVKDLLDYFIEGLIYSFYEIFLGYRS